MTKREIWNNLDAGWRRAFRKTMRRWMRHVKEGGYWTGEASAKVGCYLCAYRGETGYSCTTICPIGREQGGGCETVNAYGEWNAKMLAYDDYITKRKPLREAKAVLRYLCGFPPKSDKTRQDAEALLARRKQ